MKSLFLLCLLPALISAQNPSYFKLEQSSQNIDLISAITIQANSIFVCRAQSSSFGQSYDMVLEKYQLDGQLLQQKTIPWSFESILGLHWTTINNELVLWGSTVLDSTDEGALFWLKVDSDLTIADPNFYLLGQAFVEYFSIDQVQDLIYVGGSKQSSTFSSSPFCLLIDQNLQLFDSFQDQEGAWDVQGIIGLADGYVLLGAGLWKFNMNHQLLAYQALENAELAKCVGVRTLDGKLLTLRHVFDWDSGSKTMLLEHWDADLNLLKTNPLSPSNVRAVKSNVIQRLASGEYLISLYSSTFNMGFPFVLSQSKHHFLVLNPTLNVIGQKTFSFEDYLYPCQIISGTNRVWSGGFKVKDASRLEPYLYHIPTPWTIGIESNLDSTESDWSIEGRTNLYSKPFIESKVQKNK